MKINCLVASMNITNWKATDTFNGDRSVVCTLLIVCAHKGIDECTLRQKNHANRIQTK